METDRSSLQTQLVSHSTKSTDDPHIENSAADAKSVTGMMIQEPGDSLWPWFGQNGLRAGWSLVLFGISVYLLAMFFGAILAGIVDQGLHWRVAAASAASTILGESQWVGALAVAMMLLSLIEKRHISAYYLGDRMGLRHFAEGLVIGFGALSLLIGGLALGGWIRFGSHTLTGIYIFKYGGLWALGFLCVGLFEEGSFRCYVQFTLTRGVNFWWAAGIVGAMCAFLVATDRGNGAWGVYAIGLTGIAPAWWVERRHPPSASFWQAAWVSSTGFGFIHTFNHGENWIGILAAAAIGFVFCVSVWLTGSAWWAIGCHTAWDWAESFFYGTADSGFTAKGHYLSTISTGPSLWSGGADGPEGSIVVLPVIALMLIALLLVYRKRHHLPAKTGNMQAQSR